MHVLAPFRNRSSRIVLGVLALFAIPALVLAEAGPPPKMETVLADRLVAADGGRFENFGFAIALSGSTALVGAPGNDDYRRRDGAAYVFEQDPDDGTWEQVAKLLPPAEKGLPFGGPSDMGDNFGFAVAVSGDVAVVGAPGEDAGGDLDSGAAYVFERGEGDWDFVARLSAGAETDRRFGLAVAAAGGVVVVGAPGDPGAVRLAGSAHVFERGADGTWTETAELAPADGAIGDFLGFSVAVDGTTALVGAPFADSTGRYSGAAYVFERDAGGTWSESVRLLGSDTERGDRFGLAVAIAEATAVVGAPKHYVPVGEFSGRNAGAAYVFERGESGSWAELTQLVASDHFRNDRFGESVAISGDTAIVGATGQDAHAFTGRFGSGSLYVFRPDTEGAWTEHAQLFDEEAGAFDLLGAAVAVSGKTFLAGTPLNDDRGASSGSVMVFQLGSKSALFVKP